MYRADVPTYFWPKVGGWLLVPTAGALATKLLAPLADSAFSAVMKDPAKQPSPAKVAATVGACAQAAAAFVAYRVSEGDSPVGTQAFARGGMWGSMLAAATLATSLAWYDETPMPAVSGATSPLLDKAFGLLTAQAAGAVAAKRVGAFRPALLR